MQSHRSLVFLRRVLAADALTCFATGLLMMFGSDGLAELLGLPETLLRYAGVSLIPVAAVLAYLASREALSQTMVWAVIVLNVLWTVDSFLLVVTGWATPTGFGYVFIIAQAMGVTTFAGLEYVGLKQSLAAKAVPALAIRRVWSSSFSVGGVNETTS